MAAPVHEQEPDRRDARWPAAAQWLTEGEWRPAVLGMLLGVLLVAGMHAAVRWLHPVLLCLGLAAGSLLLAWQMSGPSRKR